MGIDFSHAGAHWTYSFFHLFRVRLAAEIGVDLNQMEGFVRNNERPACSWELVDDPIKPLLRCSDSGGELSPEESRAIAPRLRELIADWPDDDPDKSKALSLAEGMELAATQNEPFVCY
ncbi:hypothetical protein JXA32_03915 [Candidatus Sumerlaeota bacterium]|nr:hypothetical protein [Candidatus Sumerlaeota bacterium]